MLVQRLFAVHVAALPTLMLAAAAATAPAQCIPDWTPGFGATGINGPVHALAVFDDGTGNSVYAGGLFSTAGGVTAKNIARWDGTVWTPLASGLNGTVRAFATFDPDGPGPESELLFAGGDFPGFLSAWDGSAWVAVTPAPDGIVRALAAYDDGSGPALHAAGDFLNVGNKPAARIARWDGASWKSLSSGISGNVYSLAVYDDGDGPGLYAGGIFTQAGGNPANRIARWDGLAWSALGSGTSGAVTSLAVHDDGSGPALYAGGLFNTAGGNSASRIARWNGSQWSALKGGVSDIVYSMAVHTTAGDADLYVGGQFTQADGKPAAHIARWEGPGVGWVALEGGADNNVLALASYEDARGPTLIAGGDFVKADGGTVNRVGQWREAAWSGLGAAVDDAIRALRTYDDGSGSALYAAGQFLNAGGVALSYVGQWNGVFWMPLGPGLNDPADAMAVFDPGTGPALYVAGSFTWAGGKTVSRIASWNGTAWSDVGGGVNGQTLLALQAYNDGAGEALYAGGQFSKAGGVDASNIARWNGLSWSALATGVNGTVRAMAVLDDGGGAALFAAGGFNTAGGISVSNIAKWNGLSWSKLDSGINNTVYALATFDDGSGPALYAAGQFTSAGGDPASNIARWNGLEWSKLGTGLNGWVRALAVHDDGAGTALYAAGDFTQAGGKPAARIAKWDGLQWSALGSGINGSVNALASHHEGDQSALFAGGSFATAGGLSSSNIARWGCQAPPANLCETSSLTDPNAQPADFMGESISISGDTLIAGAFGDDSEGENAGALHIYTRAGARWNYSTTVVPDDIIAGDFFGASAALDGDYALVGAPRADPAGATSGAAYIFERDGGAWTQAAKLVPDDAATTDQFGSSVSLLGEVAVIGAWKASLPGKADAGAAYIFVRENGAWVQKFKLTAPDAAAQDNFGAAVAIAETFAVVGAPARDSAGDVDSGAGYVFFRVGDQWGHWQTIVPGGTEAGDGVGYKVAADDKRLLLGAPDSDRIAPDAGAAYVYRVAGGEWLPEQTLNPFGSEAGDGAGFSVALRGPRALVGSPFSDLQGEDSGAVTMYALDGVEWFEVANLTGADIEPGDWLGTSVSIAPGFLAAGALHADGPGGADQGLVLIYSTTGCPCYADFTGDETLDLFDFLEYVNSFNANQPAADCDGSGGLDLFDFLCFANAFNAGC